jgi:hypothetical protein
MLVRENQSGGGGVASPAVAEVPAGRLDSLAAILEVLHQPSPAGDPAADIDEIALLERLKGAVAGAQVQLVARFADTVEADRRHRGVSSRRVGDGIADQIALACRVSATTGANRLTQARALTRQLPHTLAQLKAGDVSEWVATLVVNHTNALTEEDRLAVDAELAGRIGSMSPREVSVAATRAAIRIDPASAVRRGRTARADRRVTIRPAPDTMALVTGLLPCEQGVAIWAVLEAQAKTLRGQGDARSMDQIRADTYYQRLTGRDTTSAIPIELGLVMTTDALLDVDTDDTTATLTGYGPIPTDLARALVGIRTEPAAELEAGRDIDGARVRDAADADRDAARVFIRRVFTDPVDHTVTTIDTRRRRFATAVARFLGYRDQACRFPYCTAPIRQVDHIRPHRDGGSTNAGNGQGLCEHHNYSKETPGWTTSVQNHVPHTTSITTPTGHTHQSQAPPPLGIGRPRRILRT